MIETTREWTRTEGVIIAEYLDPKAVADFINETKVVAAIDWYDRTPNLIGLTLASFDRKLAAVNDLGEIIPSVEFEDFALDVAQKFNAEVLVGGVSADALPEGAEVTSQVDFELEESALCKTVQLSRIPSSSIPLAAALAGIDIVSVELEEGWQVVAYDSDYDASIAAFGDHPILTLMVSEGEFVASLDDNGDSEMLVMYNWSMSTRTLAGGHSDDAVYAQAEELVGASTDLRALAEVMPNTDVKAAEATAQLNGTDAVMSFVAALGLPGAVGEFLLGQRAATDIPGAELHEARGISNAIGRSVDKILLEPDSAGNAIWEAYHKVAVERPAIVRTIASVEAALGGMLVANAIRMRKQRSGWVNFGGVIGAFMMVDSVAEVLLAKYLGQRAKRRRQS